MYTAESILNPEFRLDQAEDNGKRCCDLFLQTFYSTGTPAIWQSNPAVKWHRLARIFPDRIVTFPVFTSPHAKRYLSSRHGRIRTVIHETDESQELPETLDEALLKIGCYMQPPIWNDFSFGLGLSKNLDPIWHGLLHLPGVNTIIVTSKSNLEVDDVAVRIPHQYLDELRWEFDRLSRKLRENVRLAKQGQVRNELLSKLSPEQFPIIAQPQIGGLSGFRSITSPSAASERKRRRASVEAVRESAEQIAKDTPRALIELHAEIERVTLASMIEKFENKLNQPLSEAHWQIFFQDNIFLLSLLFARPVQLVSTQFHAQGSQLDGTGAQIGDFLLRELGQSLAIVEIKKPSSPLMQSTAYRNSKVYGPHSDLSGAITQVLYQQTSLHSNWLYHQQQLRDSYADSIKCIVISGLSPAEDEQRRCFDLFRNACKDVDVVTFDELLAKLKLLQQHLSLKAETDIESADSQH